MNLSEESALKEASRTGKRDFGRKNKSELSSWRYRYCFSFYIDWSMEMTFGPEKIEKTVISWLNSCSFNTRISKIVSLNVLADSTV